jgi:hypothetical protein
MVGVDCYEEFKMVYEKKLRIIDNNVYLWITIVNRLLVMVFSFYLLSQMITGDLIYLPVLNILSGLVICGVRLLKSEKISRWISLCRKQ